MVKVISEISRFSSDLSWSQGHQFMILPVILANFTFDMITSKLL